MKKGILLFTAIGFVLMNYSCEKQDESVPVKNYYGVQPESNGTPKAAYTTLAVSAVVLLIFFAWLFKKMKGNR